MVKKTSAELMKRATEIAEHSKAIIRLLFKTAVRVRASQIRWSCKSMAVVDGWFRVTAAEIKKVIKVRR